MAGTEPPHNFLGLDREWSSFERSKVVVLPVPYEFTTSYGKGTASAPQSIIEASAYVELYDEELDCEIFRLSDGIATLPAMHFDGALRDEAAVNAICAAVSALLKQGKTVISVGGEHTIAAGTARAYSENVPELSILHLDAHSDLRPEYEGSKYSHASAAARIYEFHPDIVQVGIRSQSIEESLFIREHSIPVFYAVDIKRGRYGREEAWHDEVIGKLKKNVYVTFDCDFLDPALMPALGTPEPGGFGWYETIRFLRYLSEKRSVAGFDINEFSPIPHFNHPQFVIAKLMYKFIGYMSGPRTV